MTQLNAIFVHTHVSEKIPQETHLHTKISACAYFKACLDDSDWQHEKPCHRPGPTSQQHGLHGPWAAVLEEVLLQ